MNSGKIRFVSVFVVFSMLFFFASCNKSSGKKCSEDRECGHGSYCSIEEGKEKGKCAEFGENDYKIAITSPENEAHVCGEVTVEAALSEVSEKLHDGMEVALSVAKGKDMQTFQDVFSENKVSFEIDLAGKGEYKLAAFLIQDPFVKSEITLFCDSDPEPEDDGDTTPDDDDTEPVDDSDTDTPVDDSDTDTPVDDSDTDTPVDDTDSDTEPDEDEPVAATIEILAPWNSDKTGDGEADTCKANNYGAIVHNGTIYVGTTQDSIDGEDFGVCFKVGFSNTAAGAKFNVYTKNGEAWSPVWEGTLTESGVEAGFIMVSGLVLNEGENTVKVVVGGKSEEIPDAEFVQKIVVATESPAISWAYPPNNYVLSQNNFSSGIFATFNITNSIPGLEVELFEGNSSVATVESARFGAESLSFKNPELADACGARTFHAVFNDTLNDKTVDSGNRNITFDINPVSIDSVKIAGKNGEEIVSTVNESQNPVTVTVSLSDAANTAGDSNRTVTLYTNGGSGTPNKPLATLNNAGDQAVFEDITLTEAVHTLKIEVKDCTGNISSEVLNPVTVSMTKPLLTVVSPKGTGDDWRWLTLADVSELEGASVAEGELAGVKMHVVSDKVLGAITNVSHIFGSDSNDITENATLSEDRTNIFINLPNLENGKHKFTVSVVDFAGNPGKTGGADEEYYEVDVVAPTITSLVFNAENYPVKMTLATENIDSETPFTLVATKGEIVKTWNGLITESGSLEKSLHLSKGAWNATLTLTDDHGNTTVATGDFEVTEDIPDIVLKKNDGTIINVGSAEKPTWFIPKELEDCAESSCSVSIRIYAPEGTEINYGISSSTIVTIGPDGFETVKIPLSLIAVSELSISSGLYSEIYYLAATDKTPTVQISNPTVCPKSAEYCNIYELDDDVSTDVIELAEVGFGYDDDLTPGDGILNFKTASAIKFTVSNVSGGFMEIENAPDGAKYTRVKLAAGDENTYIADFSNLILPDVEAGQTDYDLNFVLTTDSGIVQKYYVPVHLDLALPEPVPAAKSASTADALLGKLNFSWNPAATMPYAYEVRYQSYDEGSCSIVDDFDTATIPLTEYAGNIPAPSSAATMSYNFFVNAVSNTAGTVTADIHKNGNSYCAAVKAVNAVVSYNGLPMAKNLGVINENSVKDFGSLKMEWENIYEASSGFHNFRLKIIGDVNNDGFEDYAIADRHKSDSGVDNDMNGFVDVYSGIDHSLIKSIRGAFGSDISVGQDISSKADFNNDGFDDFVYTDYPGNVFVFYGTENGINFDVTPATFRAKDASDQGNRGLATGDYNGDGCDDIMISAPGKKVGDYNSAGEVYLYYGCKEGGFAEEPDLTFTGNAANARIGNSGIMDVGDLNGDGKTDFAFGSANALYIVYGGSADGTLSPKIKSLYNPVSYMGTGDFNGDGYSDLVYNYVSSTSAESRIYYGSSSGIRTTADLKINDFSAIYDNYENSPTYNTLAVSVHAKDLNGDGADDLVITSSTGVLIFYTYTDRTTGEKQLRTQPSVFDGFSSQAGLDPKIMMLDDALIYCDNLKAAGNCERLNF